MHWVDRGPEPAGLAAIRAEYTPRWAAYYPEQVGVKPRDSRWRDFHDALSLAFAGLCAYCEERDKGEVDHFRPKSQFPALVYAWSNWLFACHNCNQAKGEQWPAAGYVDPCADSALDLPENFFRFDTATGEIIPVPGLTPERQDQAQNTIDDLSLNAGYHLKERLDWLTLVAAAISGNPNPPEAEEENLRAGLTARNAKLSSLARAFLAEQGYPQGNCIYL